MNANPFRYRGYYYDNETGFYYLQSRYYDPSTGRFINADITVCSYEAFNGYNMFAYCLNNPLNFIDIFGCTPVNLWDYLNDLFKFVSNIQKEVTLAPIKSQILTAAQLYLMSRGYVLSNKMFSWSLYGEGQTLPQDIIDNFMIGQFMRSSSLVSLLTSIYEEYHDRILLDKDKYNNFVLKRPISFEGADERDLFFSVHQASVRVQMNFMYNLVCFTVTVYDIYDFTEYLCDPSFTSVANNLGFIMQAAGALIPYYWEATYVALFPI